MRMALLIAVLAPIALAAVNAQAQTQVTTQDCKDKPDGVRSCVSRTFTEQPAPPRALTLRETSEVNARIMAWESYCKPRIRVDAQGVGRYQYAHPGCEFGRSSDDLPLSTGCLLSAFDSCRSLSSSQGLSSSADSPPGERATTGSR